MGHYVISGRERRRRWSLEEKRAIVTAAFAPGAVVSEVARRADVCANQIYRWRRDLGLAPIGFAEMVIVADSQSCGSGTTSFIAIDLSSGSRLRIPSDIPPALASAVVAALSLR